MKSPLDKVLDLISLALDNNVSPEEARSAAMSAITLIRKHDLLIANVEVKRLKRTPEVVTAKRMQKLAEECANQVVSDLVKRSILGEYPTVSSSRITYEWGDKRNLSSSEKEAFARQLKVALNVKVKHGLLISKSGWQGGYQLAQTKR